jgi:tetratricopeptide (TPR) repeat protein
LNTGGNEFNIYLGGPSRHGRHGVTARVLPSGVSASGSFRLPFAEEELDQARAWLQQGLHDDPHVYAFGARLFAALIDGEVMTGYQAAHRGGRLARCRLSFDDPSLHRVPWELLYDPQRNVYLSSAGTVVRDIDSTPAPDPMPVGPPIGLLVAGGPTGESQARVAQLHEAAVRLVDGNRLKLTVVPSASSDRLRRAPAPPGPEPPPWPWHVVHLAVPATRNLRTGKVVVLLSMADGGTSELDAEQLAGLLASDDLRLLVLDLSPATEVTTLDVLSEFGPVLLRGGVPAVLGLADGVASWDGPAALEQLYGALAAGQPIDAAAAASNGPATPARSICYLRPTIGRLTIPAAVSTPAPAAAPVEAHGAVPHRPAWRPTPRRIVASVSALLGFLATLTGLYSFYTDRLASHPVPPMTGDLNLAVAAFDLLDNRGRSAAAGDPGGFAEALAQELETQVGSRAAGGLQVQLRSPTQTGTITGPTPDRQAVDAERRARQLNAHIVVYGTLAYDDAGTSAAPRFYVAPAGMRNAEELTGAFAFGSPIIESGDAVHEPTARRDLRRRLVARTQALVQFTLGRGWYRTNQFDDAARAFAAAEQAHGWDDRDGKEVLYLFTGNTAGKQGDYDAAEAAYQRALKLNPGYARAKLGLGEVYLHQAAPSCTPKALDVARLHDAVRLFEEAQTSPDQPPLSDVAVKASFQLARASVCLSQAGATNAWQEATELFERVVHAYEAGNDRVRQLAAESHFGLAVIAAPDPKPQDSRTLLERAATECEKATMLSRDSPGRAMVFARHLDRIRTALSQAEPERRPPKDTTNPTP